MFRNTHHRYKGRQDERDQAFIERQEERDAFFANLRETEPELTEDEILSRWNAGKSTLKFGLLESSTERST